MALFSSPMAGMVACLWQAFPQKTNQEIRELIVKASDRFSAPIINMAMVFLILLWLFVINSNHQIMMMIL
jgi:hypothetical protein